MTKITNTRYFIDYKTETIFDNEYDEEYSFDELKDDYESLFFDGYHQTSTEEEKDNSLESLIEYIEEGGTDDLSSIIFEMVY